jgi:hypothetical protein
MLWSNLLLLPCPSDTGASSLAPGVDSPLSPGPSPREVDRLAADMEAAANISGSAEESNAAPPSADIMAGGGDSTGGDVADTAGAAAGGDTANGGGGGLLQSVKDTFMGGQSYPQGETQGLAGGRWWGRGWGLA